MKLTFEPQGSDDAKDLKALVEKLRGRFKVAAAASGDLEDTGEISLTIAAVHPQEEKLSQKLDQIVDFCEETGFGRVETERSLLDHVDVLDELARDEEE